MKHTDMGEVKFFTGVSITFFMITIVGIVCNDFGAVIIGVIFTTFFFAYRCEYIKMIRRWESYNAWIESQEKD
jgi:ABC-type enterochelin transport system permease subunit